MELRVHFQTQIAFTYSSVHHRPGTQYDLAKDWDTGCGSLRTVVDNLYTKESSFSASCVNKIHSTCFTSQSGLCSSWWVTDYRKETDQNMTHSTEKTQQPLHQIHWDNKTIDGKITATQERSPEEQRCMISVPLRLYLVIFTQTTTKMVTCT